MTRRLEMLFCRFSLLKNVKVCPVLLLPLYSVHPQASHCVFWVSSSCHGNAPQSRADPISPKKGIISSIPHSVFLRHVALMLILACHCLHEWVRRDFAVVKLDPAVDPPVFHANLIKSSLLPVPVYG